MRNQTLVQLFQLNNDSNLKTCITFSIIILNKKPQKFIILSLLNNNWFKLFKTNQYDIPSFFTQPLQTSSKDKFILIFSQMFSQNPVVGRPWAQPSRLITDCSPRKGKDKKNRSSLRSSISHGVVMLSIIMMLNIDPVSAQVTNFLEGIGYREQNLQTAKTGSFASNAATGITKASFAGGTNIFIKGHGFNQNPQSNMVILRLISQNQNQEIAAPFLNEDDAFQSSPDTGHITYRLPSLHDLFEGVGMTDEDIALYDYMQFILTVMRPDGKRLKCDFEQNCLITYHRAYTPRLHYLSPPVVYPESYTQIWFDPKYAGSLVDGLLEEEKAFVSARIGPSVMDFENTVSHEDTYSGYRGFACESIIGKVGELAVGPVNDIKLLWEVGLSYQNMDSMTHCTYDNQTCYKALSVPVIYDVSNSQTYTSGGQNLTVEGFGFHNQTITATVDGENCAVTQQALHSFSCEVGSKSSASTTNSPRVGSNGIKREIYDYKARKAVTGNSLSLNSMTDSGFLPNKTRVELSFEKPYMWNYETNLTILQDIDQVDPTAQTFGDSTDESGSIFRGWFVPPASTRYKFYQSCEGDCNLWLSTTADDESAKSEIIADGSSSSRRYYSKYTEQKSDWITLTAGQNYYIEGRTYNKEGGDSYSVGVEIEQSSMTGHHHAIKEIQTIGVFVGETDRDTITINITNQDDGTFKLIFQNQWQQNPGVISNDCKTKATAAEMSSCLWYYHAWFCGWNDVEATFYDANGTEVNDPVTGGTGIYEVKARKLTNGKCADNIITVAQGTTTSGIVVQNSDENGKASSPPLSGQMKIKCETPGGVKSETRCASRGRSDWEWGNYISEDCKGFADKVTVLDNNLNNTWTIGRHIDIRFEGEHDGSPGEFGFVDCSLEGNQRTNYSSVKQAGGTNLFYDAIPFEMLKTYETEPQLIVTVGGTPAVCHNMTCDVTYISAVGEITGSTFNSANKKLTITGTGMPTNISDYQDIYFAKSKCSIDSSTMTATGVECTLDHDPVCGDHVVFVNHILGRIPNSNSYTGETSVTCAITDMSIVDTKLNLLGNDNITFTGSNLPRDLSLNTVSITFNDAQNTVCDPKVLTSNQLICTTNAFRTQDTSTTMTPSIVINGKTASHSVSKQTKPSIVAATAISPSSVNPTLVSDLTLTLSNSFPFTLNRDDFTVEAYNVSNPTYRRQIKVNTVDDSAKTLTGKFQGAWSGTYGITLKHATYGLIDASGLSLDVNTEVTGISPSTGSIYGGRLITITGTNFGTEATDNPVQLFGAGQRGGIDCIVESISTTQIQCRIDSDTTNWDTTLGTTASVNVFLKLSEDAVCADSVCKDTFTFTDSIPEVTASSHAFDTTHKAWVVTVTGTGFGTSTSTTIYSVNGVQQETLSVSATEAKFKLTNLTSSTVTGQKLLFEIGKPKGHSFVEAQFTITPKTQVITPNFGSVFGQVAKFVAPGITVGDLETVQGLRVIKRGDANAVNLCSKITVPEMGVVVCELYGGGLYGSGDYSGMPPKFLSVWNGGEHGCDPEADCRFQATPTDNMPKLISSTKSSDTQIVLTGSGFTFTTGVTPSISFMGINADSLTIDSDTQATATFTQGVPLGTGIPKITFTNDTDPYIQYYSQNGTAMTNAFTVDSQSSGLQCSFAGGCTYEVQAKGLTRMISHNQSASFIEVCNDVCVLDESQSTPTSAKCKLPQLSTIYSNENFGIARESEDLDSGRYFGDFENNAMLFDNDLLTVPSSTIFEDKACQIGMGFKKGHVGMISQVKWYMADMDENTKNYYIDKTQFQGSNDQYINWNTIFTMDENIHAGWNYHEWTNPSDYPKYRFYRFFNDDVAGCQLNEIIFRGVETIDNSWDTYQCDVKVNLVDESETSLNTVTYTHTLTPTLTAVSPRYGTVTGGTSVTFTGANYPTDTSLYTITLDGINCPVSGATSTSVTCTTGSRPGYVATKTEILISGYGLVANDGHVYTYASAWSDDTTWGGLFAPGEGESISVPPGLNLLVDIDETPILNAVFVEGSILFVPDSDPNHHRKFDAHYLFVTNKGSKMEVGTEEFPYTSRLTITMHSTVDDPYLPIYGNKAIGCRECILDMHGVERNPVWTYLDSTVDPGATQITLASVVDWQVGEMIAIAPTGYNSQEGEHRTISAVSSDGSKSTLTLDQPLTYKHFAQIQTYGNEVIDTRAEVGLLSRNVVFRGDPETSKRDEYGAAIFLHSEGDDSLTARFSYIELTDVGQAFKLGRYAIHFHMIGAVYSSYVKGVAIHQSNNRAVTMHGVHHLRVLNNVVYKAKGHNIFIEDAVETNNYCKDNLLISVTRSWSILNTDQTPAGFWITHPNNHLIGNHIGGSDRYGIWYDLKPKPQGPSAHMKLCPHYSRVGINDNNAAHSVGRYGLRIFHEMQPRKYPCAPFTYDEMNKEDPYWTNPPIETNINNFTSWKNNRDGAIAQFLAWVKFNNFKVADNLECGVQQSILTLKGNYGGVFNSLIIGTSAAAEEKTYAHAQYGAMGPRSEYWQVRDTSFYGFSHNVTLDSNGGEVWPAVPSSAFGFCSHCTHHNTRTSGAHTYTVSGIYLHSDVDIVVRWQIPYNGIILDEDGGVTGWGPHTWLAGSNTLRHLPECEGGNIRYGGSRFGQDYAFGVRCNSDVAIRQVRIDSSSAKPGQNMKLAQWQLLPYDDSIIGNMDNETFNSYIYNLGNRGSQFYFPEGWAQPLATGHKYRMFFASLDGVTLDDYGTALQAPNIDWEYLKMDLPYIWNKTDKSIYFTHTYTEYRSDWNLTKDGELKRNGTIPESESQYWGGQNFWNNETAEIAFIVDGKGKQTPMSPVVYALTAAPEIVAEDIDVLEDEDAPVEDFERYWSDVANWPNYQLPQEGEDVEIQRAWNMILDIPETPILRVLKVNGRLTFSDTMDIHLKVKHISIRASTDAGELKIGSPYEPFQHRAIITLYGTKDENAVLYPGAWSPGSKLIASAGLLQMVGKPRASNSYFSRLKADVYQGWNEFYVDTGLDWTQGDRLVIGPTSYGATTEEVFVSAYDSSNGKVTLTGGVKYYHFGQAESTGNIHNAVDMRAEVMLMSRSILLQNEEDLGLGTNNPCQGCISGNAWSGRVLIGESVEFSATTYQLVTRPGRALISDVEIHGFGGMDTTEAAISFVGAKTNASSVTNCAIHNGLGWGALIKGSKDVEFSNNYIFNTRPFGLVVDLSQNILIDSNIIMKVVSRGMAGSGSYKDKEGGMAICAVYASDKTCTNVTANNNIVADASTNGYWAMAHPCAEDNTNFYNNTVHSCWAAHGVIFRGHVEGTCFGASYFTAYKMTENAATSMQGGPIDLEYHHMTMIDNKNGFMPIASVSHGRGLATMRLYENKVYGEYAPMLDCPSDGSFCHQFSKTGWKINGVTTDGRSNIPTMHVAYPYDFIMGDANNNQRMIMEKNQFINFHQNTVQNNPQHAIKINGNFLGDYYPIQEWTDTIFVNCTSDKLAYISDPKPGWAVIDDCGLWPCTGPANVLMNFKSSVFQEAQPEYASLGDFQIISDNGEFSPYVSNCTKYDNMNAYVCQNNDLGIMLYESKDSDKYDRAIAPVYFGVTGTSINNTVNSYMDHVWDGFYTGQVRLSAFPSLITAPKGQNNTVEITMTGTPPKKMKFQLMSQNRDSSLGTTVRIAYPDAGTKAIFKNGAEMPMNDWNDSIQTYGPITQSHCGENRFIGIQNILEFYIESGCDLEIKPIDSVATMVRMDFTMDEFFSGGGTTNFIDRLSSSLGIHASDVKIVSVYEGSLVVNYELTSSDGNPETLVALQQQQSALLSSGNVDLGAPIMEHASSVVVDQDRTFTGAQHEVFALEVNTEGEKAWEESYITFDYEPIVIIDDETQELPMVDEDSDEGHHEQAIRDREEQYNNDMLEEAVVDDYKYVPGSIENPEYQANNVGAQNSFDGAAVVTKENKVYQNVVAQGDNQPVYKYTTEQTVIVTEKDPEVIQLDSEEKQKTLLVPVVFSVIIVIALAFCIRQFMNSKAHQQTINQAEDRAMRIRTMQEQELSECKANVIDLGGAMKQNEYDDVARDSMVNSIDVNKVGNDIYSSQYDPNNDFAVFGVGDPRQGGIQSMKEKMNLADNVEDIMEDSDEDNNTERKQDPYVHQPLPQDSSTKDRSVSGADENSNDLPEDKELASEAGDLDE